MPQDSVGLRLSARRLKLKKVKASKSLTKGEKEGSDNFDSDSEVEKKDIEFLDERTGETDTTIKEEEKNTNDETTCVLNKEVDLENVGNECTVETEDEKMDIENIGNECVVGNLSSQDSAEEDIGKDLSNVNSDQDIKIEKEEIDSEDVKDKDALSKTNSSLVMTKGKLTRDQNRQNSFEEYIALVKNKYQEDKENVFALDLLKQHPPKVDTDLINVSDSMLKRTHYPKVFKPASKLDHLLEKRVKQDEFEHKQRMGIETQIALKTKLNQAIEEAKKKKEVESNSKEENNKKDDNNTKDDNENKTGDVLHKQLPYSCYSLSCKSKDTGFYNKCYSIACRANKRMEKSDSFESSLSKISDETGFSSNVSSRRNSKDGSDSETASETENQEFTDSMDDNIQKRDLSIEDEDVDIEDDGHKADSVSLLRMNASKNDLSSSKDDKFLTASSNKTNKGTSVSDIVKNLVIKTMAEKAASGKGPTISAQALAISVEELESKLPPKRSTSDKFKLAKFTKLNKKNTTKSSKDNRLPMCHKFETSSKKKSVLILDKNELRKLARFGSRKESTMFNYNCKMNNVCWPYPCPRPVFKTAWRYRTMTLQSLSAAALQLKILWACIR